MVSRIQLFHRTRRYPHLPADGGLDDQDEAVMEALDIMNIAAQEVARGGRR